MANKNSDYYTNWQNKFNELSYKVFYQNKEGAELLKLLEERFFRSPVAFPNQEPSWAFFNEGKNEMIRMFTVGLQSYMNEERKDGKQKDVKRSIK